MNIPWNNLRKLHLTSVAISFIISVTLLTLLLPRSEEVGYVYEEGKPWRYESLIAPYDFPVNKSAKDIQAEKDSLTKAFSPFFMLDNEVEEKQIDQLREDYDKGVFNTLPEDYLRHISNLLRHVYDAGLMDTETYSQMQENEVATIRIVDETEAVSRGMNDVFSIRTAYEYVMQADTMNYRRNILSTVNLSHYLEPNITIDTAKNNAMLADIFSNLSKTSGMVQAGERIIDLGDKLTNQDVKILDSFQEEMRRRGTTESSAKWQIVIGQTLFNASCLALLIVFLLVYRTNLLKRHHSVNLLFTVVTLFPLLCHLFVTRNMLSVYIIPFAMVGVFVRIFTDSRTAMIASIVAILLASIGLRNPYEFILIQFSSSVVAIIGVSDLTERSQLLRVALMVTAVALVFDLFYDLSRGITFATLDRAHYIYIGVSGLTLLLAYPLLYLIERIFGFTSNVTLVELTNINTPLLSRLSKEAQGTFQHSMQVANLAAEVADALGAQSQLVRAAAFYHDIGKLSSPLYFTENQSGVNPHDKIKNEQESALIIINHVHEGIRLAEKYNLPKVIIDFIKTHHGRSQVKYFSIQWQNSHPGEPVNEESFTYPGPDPHTKEQAILMMCDAVEASSRSLKNYTTEGITSLVDRIVDAQVNDGRFKKCPISFLDIDVAKQTLVECLQNIHHTRIAYPELKANAKESQETSGTAVEEKTNTAISSDSNQQTDNAMGQSYDLPEKESGMSETLSGNSAEKQIASGKSSDKAGASSNTSALKNASAEQLDAQSPQANKELDKTDADSQQAEDNDAIVKPADATIKPAVATIKPTDTIVKPTAATSKPNSTIIKSAAEETEDSAAIISTQTSVHENDDEPQHSGFFHTRRKE